MSLRNKVVLITGGGTGIGEACARRFASEGAHVAVMGRRSGPVERVAAEIGGIALTGDASRDAEVRRALELVLERHGGLDALIACAGGLGNGSALETDDASWEACLRANLTSAFVSAREALPSLLARRGAIVIVSSIAGLAAGPEVCGYTTAKHALIGLTRSLARDYGPRGVRVNAVCPGWVRTPMADEEMLPLMERNGISLEEAYAVATCEVPLRRPASPDEIAAVCRFLASEEASIVTGAVLPADGGSTIVDVPTLAFSWSA
ncbi:MAG: SDR family oxidoreductase [Deltaproteobacteria bacterium]|nr:SDR family oxidoreductase [Deltaproteobacteria bacterium]